MRYFMKASILIATGILMCVSAGAAAPAERGPTEIRRIVVFEETVELARQLQLVRGAGARELRPLQLINAVAVMLPDVASQRALEALSEVVRVDRDLDIHAQTIDLEAVQEIMSAESLGMEIPWGVERVGAPTAWENTGVTGEYVKVVVMDTGIQRDHPDLQEAVMGGRSFLRGSPRLWDDDHGHGTHVAGSAAAYGDLVGVAPGAYLYAAKVLDKNGSGTLSSLIDALQWSIDQGMQVVNMSLGASDGNQSFQDAIKATHEAGLVLVASAGNSGPGDNTVTYPAAYPETVAVAASDSNDNIPSWSSRGEEVDITAPGVSIKSTWIGSGYRTLSGTSMAAPHVSGVAALVISRDGMMDTVEMRARLTTTAEDLGHDSTAQGAGLVRADWALSVEAEPTDPAPAFFAVANLDPAEAAVAPGEAFTVTAEIVNTGDQAGETVVAFQIGADESTLQTQSLELAGGADALVVFETSAPAEEGDYVYTVWTEDDSLSGALTVAEPAQSDGGVASVEEIVYSTSGGRFQNRHLQLAVAFVDGEANPVAGAAVEVELYRDSSLYAAVSGETGSDGVVVYNFNNAPSGTYTTTVTAFYHPDFEFDGVTPENSFTK